MSEIAGIISILGRRLLDVLIPPRCLNCGAITDTPGALCPTLRRASAIATSASILGVVVDSDHVLLDFAGGA